jgi:hypothetical protein
MTTLVNASTKCTQFIRKIPLESFRLSSDGRKWKQAARSRQNLLIRISTWANGDGTFVGDNGQNYSPSEKTITRHVNRKTYYRLSEALRQLGWLSWSREQAHYGRRLFTIHLENHLPDSPKTGDIFKAEQVTYSPKTGDLFAGTHPHGDTCYHIPMMGHYPSSPNTASVNAENPRSFTADAVAPNGSALNKTDAADGATLTADTAVSAVSPTEAAPAGNLPSNPTTGRKEGTLRAPSGEKQQADIEFSIDPVTEETPRQVQQASQQEYAINKAQAFRKLPKSIRDQVKHLRDRCRVDWDYWRTHDEDGEALTITDEDDYRFSAFPPPKSDHLLKLAELLGTYTESQILGAWKKFLNRPYEIDGLCAVWANFFLEFDDYVEVEPTVAGSVA